MNKNNLTAKVTAVIETPIEEIIPELRPLLVALLLSSNVEMTRLHTLYKDDPLMQYFLQEVQNFATDDMLFKMYADDGFFAEQLEHMLSVAKKDRRAASRLMPIFCKALNFVVEYNIPDDLRQNIIDHINDQLDYDGFAIRALDENIVDVVAA